MSLVHTSVGSALTSRYTDPLWILILDSFITSGIVITNWQRNTQYVHMQNTSTNVSHTATDRYGRWSQWPQWSRLLTGSYNIIILLAEIYYFILSEMCATCSWHSQRHVQDVQLNNIMYILNAIHTTIVKWFQ